MTGHLGYVEVVVRGWMIGDAWMREYGLGRKDSCVLVVMWGVCWRVGLGGRRRCLP